MVKEGLKFIMKQMIENLINSLLPHRQFPEIAKVIKVYEGKGRGKYCCDVKIITPGSFEETQDIISEVPLNMIWAGNSGEGIYCLPQIGVLVVVGFIRANKAYPYIQSIYADKYNCANFEKQSFLITDGKSLKFIFKEGKIYLLNGENSNLTLSSSSFAIGGDEATDFLILGDTFEKKFETLLTQFKTHTHDYTGMPSGVGTTTPSTSLASCQNPVATSLSKYGKVK